MSGISRPNSRAVSVIASLRSDIISGVLPPESRLVETALAQRYQVSRVPVREAIRSLAGEGLVVIRPYAGATVAQPPDSDASDLFDIRQKLEAAMARRAAETVQQHRQTDVVPPKWQEYRDEAWEAVQRAQAAFATDDTTELPKLNGQFHRAISRMGGSVALAGLFEQISGRIEWLYSVKGNTQLSRVAWGEHERILCAIDDGDPITAAEAMDAHMFYGKRTYLSLSEEHSKEVAGTK